MKILIPGLIMYFITGCATEPNLTDLKINKNNVQYTTVTGSRIKRMVDVENPQGINNVKVYTREDLERAGIYDLCYLRNIRC